MNNIEQEKESFINCIDKYDKIMNALYSYDNVNQATEEYVGEFLNNYGTISADLKETIHRNFYGKKNLMNHNFSFTGRKINTLLC